MLDTVFVSVASYRDLECHNTVADLFRQVGLRNQGCCAVCGLGQTCSVPHAADQEFLQC